jgi:spermidine/putrescine transport system substrate-binding protein
MQRRTFLRHGSLALTAAAFSSCASKSKTELHVFTWSDYLDPDLQKKFESLHQCSVVIDTYDSNEAMLAKLKGGATGYDIILPSSYMVKALLREKLLAPLDLSKITNSKHIDADHLKKSPDPAMTHSVPYMTAPTCIAYLRSKLGEVEPSYQLFLNPAAKNRMTLLNDMREVIGAALLSLGHSLNSINPVELKAATEVAKAWKKNLTKFENEQYKNGIASGEFFLVQGYAGELITVADENEDIAVIVPKEGAAFSCDDLCIPASAPNPTLAHAWIDFLCVPENAAQNMEYIGYRAPNTAAYPLLSEDFRGNPVLFPDDELYAKCAPIDDLGESLALWSAAWDEIKSA